MNSCFSENRWPPTRRASIPGPGVSIAAATEELALPIRIAAQKLAEHFTHSNSLPWFDAILGADSSLVSLPHNAEPIPERAAWALITVRLLGRISGQLPLEATFADSLAWFARGELEHGPSLSGKFSRTERDVMSLVESVPLSDDFRELLPYILDPHGPGSRSSVLRDPSTRKSREAKRSKGVFYTPADVAEYMASESFRTLQEHPSHLRCIDPACGSGVFLRAALRVISDSCLIDKFAYAQQGLFGLDISLMAVEMATFVLLHDCLESIIARGTSIANAWQVLRRNFSAVDALRVGPPSFKDDQARETLDREAGILPFPLTLHGDDEHAYRDPQMRSRHTSCPFIPLERIFPKAAGGFDVLLANPPYANIGHRQDFAELAAEYHSLHGCRSPRSDIYPLFVEMAWRLTCPTRSAAAIVAPLSIAYHRGRQYVACRRAMSQQPGSWRFAFFDREPHALFGEEVKTRCAILLLLIDSRTIPRVATGPLRKWTSRTRGRLFAELDFTLLGGVSIDQGIPKLGGQLQACVAMQLMKRSEKLTNFWTRRSTCLPADAFVNSGTSRVFVASTAYNFLNVFRPHRFQRGKRPPLSTNPLTVLEFDSEDKAWIAFGILSSRLTYWWWHVHCDGFHVPAWFVESIPLSDATFTPAQCTQLISGAKQLWQSLQSHIIVSLNGGSQTIAYRPLACEVERDTIDKLVLRGAGVPPEFADVLRRFVRSNAVVDEKDNSRDAIQLHFQKASVNA